MSKLASALGEKFQQNKLSILTRTFVLGDVTFKVRVPSTGEIERIFEYFKNPNLDDVEKTYQKLIENLKDIKSDEIEHKDNDIVIAGRSMREAAKNQTIVQYRITEYFKFLIPENGESLDNLEYSDIEAEFPFPIQMQFIDKINEVISPDYKDLKGK